MKAGFDPEPSPEEQEALEIALGRLLEPAKKSESAWWRRGVEEVLEEDPDA